MFITLKKEYLGHKPGETLDIHEEPIAKALCDQGICEPTPGDPYGAIMAKATEAAIGSLTKSLDSIITATLKQFADAQAKSNKNAKIAIFGEGGDGPACARVLLLP
jgi:glycine cleavage system protein P-like pyridoxal-binding family